MEIGKLYRTTNVIYAVPIDVFKSIKMNEIGLYHYEKIIELQQDNFVFLDYVVDSCGTKFCKILYKKNVYITQGPYHIENSINLLT